MFEYIRVALSIAWRLLINTPKVRKYARHPEKYPLEERFAVVKQVLIGIVDKWHTDFYLEGFEQFRNYQGKRLIVMNHLSFFDSLAFISKCEKPITFVAKKEAEKYFLVGTYIKAINGQFLDRENLMNQIRSLNEAIKLAKDPNGPDVVIFPEGKRNKIPGTRCLEFKAGTFKIAMKSNVAIFPVSVYGAFRPLDSKIHMKRYPIFVKCFEPILPEEYTKLNSFDIAERAQKLIDQGIIESKKADLELVSKMKLSKKMRAKVEEPDRIEF